MTYKNVLLLNEFEVMLLELVEYFHHQHALAGDVNRNGIPARYKIATLEHSTHLIKK